MHVDALEFRTYGRVTESHDHDFWQIVLPVKGKLDMEIGGRAGAGRQEQGAVIPAGTQHAFQAGGDNRFLVADVRSLRPDGLMEERFGRQAFFGMARPLQALLEYRTAAPAFSADMAGHWCSLLLAALGDAPQADQASAKAVERATAFMVRNLERQITVTDIASAAGVAVHRLNAAFRTIRGRTPYAQLTHMRFEKALQLLSETRLPISEIADLTGHADQSALTRRLKKHAGISPAAYRRLETAGMIQADPECSRQAATPLAKSRV